MSRALAVAKAGTALTGIFAALAVASAPLVEDEGWLLFTHPDPVSITSACAGVTGKNLKPGVTYTFNECIAMTSRAMLDHALGIMPCVTTAVIGRPKTFGAFIRFAYNAGVAGFCNSNAARKVRAGDLQGACRALQLSDAGNPVWVWATSPDGTKVKLPGLERRRGSERKMCEEGLRA